VDAHVHIHDCFPLPVFLDAACRNFREAAAAADIAWPYDTALLLTESAGSDMFATLRQTANELAPSSAAIGDWRVEATAEPSSLLARNAGGDHTYIIAGRQIVTEDGLEVLALATEQHFGEGEPTRQTLEAVRAAGAIPVLPWGFGKWLGRRGRILASLLEEVNDTPFLMGDTSHRLRSFPQPSQFGTAAKKAVKILPGTDPLPFPAQASRPGAYGFRVAGALSRETPAADLKRLIATQSLVPYGRGENLVTFVANQVAMQIRKRRSPRSVSSGAEQG
jgi:hypothetical protein